MAARASLASKEEALSQAVSALEGGGEAAVRLEALLERERGERRSMEDGLESMLVLLRSLEPAASAL